MVRAKIHVLLENVRNLEVKEDETMDSMVDGFQVGKKDEIQVVRNFHSPTKDGSTVSSNGRMKYVEVDSSGIIVLKVTNTMDSMT